METENEDEMILSDWVYDCMNERKMETLMREDEEGRSDMKRVERFVKIGIWCIQEEPSLRPSMKKVVQMLEGAVDVSTPPDPSSFISAIKE
uniref:Serine-threonine/tyrosine-protein kinase catalytic domain-containing protein n=2 Tax=Cucumis sativus TaxID=3659 RepID=A0A0A0KZA5_CUCSA